VAVADPGVSRQIVLADPDEPVGMDGGQRRGRTAHRGFMQLTGPASSAMTMPKKLAMCEAVHT